MTAFVRAKLAEASVAGAGHSSEAKRTRPASLAPSFGRALKRARLDAGAPSSGLPDPPLMERVWGEVWGAWCARRE